MIVSVNQPCYFGWLGYFDRIRRSDLHIVLDHVAFEKGSYTNRCRIKQRDGREMWLTIPAQKGLPINLMGTHEGKDLGNWRHKHSHALHQNYPNFPDLLTQEWFNRHYLVGVLKQTTDWLADLLDVRTERVGSWRLHGDKMGAKSELVLNLCKEVGATQYLSGPQGRNYLDLAAFDKAGIEVLYHDFPSDGDWGLSAVHHLFGPRSFEWPQLELTSVRCSPDSALGVAA